MEKQTAKQGKNESRQEFADSQGQENLRNSKSSTYKIVNEANKKS